MVKDETTQHSTSLHAYVIILLYKIFLFFPLSHALLSTLSNPVFRRPASKLCSLLLLLSRIISSTSFEVLIIEQVRS
jgi:hypothetical protein